MRIKIHSILIGLGSILIFFSWVSQNYYNKQYEKEYRMGQHLMDLVAKEIFSCNLFLIEHDRLLKGHPVDYELLAKNSIKLCGEMSTAIYLTEGMAAKVYSTELPKHVISMEELDKLHLLEMQKNFSEVIRETEPIIVKYEKRLGMPKVVYDQQKLARKKADEWNLKFLQFYIVGSILVSFGWILKIKEAKYLSKPTTSPGPR